MKLWRSVLLMVLLASCAARLQATHLIIHDPLGASTPVGMAFTFRSNTAGGGVLMFTNASGVNWFNLYFITPPPQPTQPNITCNGNPDFRACVVLQDQFGGVSNVAFATAGLGIPNGDTFSVDLGNSGWTPDGLFLAKANYLPVSYVPEPGTLLLVAGGVIPILARKRWF